jgi:hypothetical protein
MSGRFHLGWGGRFGPEYAYRSLEQEHQQSHNNTPQYPVPMNPLLFHSSNSFSLILLVWAQIHNYLAMISHHQRALNDNTFSANSYGSNHGNHGIKAPAITRVRATHLP